MCVPTCDTYNITFVFFIIKSELDKPSDASTVATSSFGEESKCKDTSLHRRMDSSHCQYAQSPHEDEHMSSFDQCQYKDDLPQCTKNWSQHKAQLGEESESQCNGDHLQHRSSNQNQRKAKRSHDTKGESHCTIDPFQLQEDRLCQHKDGQPGNDGRGQDNNWSAAQKWRDHLARLTVHVPELRIAPPGNAVLNHLGAQHLSQPRSHDEHGHTRVPGARSGTSGMVSVTESMLRSFILTAIGFLNGWIASVGNSRRHRMRLAIAGSTNTPREHIPTPTSNLALTSLLPPPYLHDH